METGTSSVVDDVFPSDVNEDIEQRVRQKSTIKITVEIRRGKKEEEVKLNDDGIPELRKVPAFVHFQRKPKARRIHK